MKTDFKLHVKISSQVATHCLSWALSDPDNQQYQSHGTDHEHNYRCPHCIAFKSGVNDVKVELLSLDWEADFLNEVLYLLDNADLDIVKWVAHQIRTVYQDKVKADILGNLQPGKEVYIIVDWAMKWLPRKGRETQYDWYGK